MRDLPANVQERLLSQGAHKDSVFTLDNRRLYAAKTAGVSNIPFEMGYSRGIVKN